jgi:LuxR family maltose regulon positive regulatory protein
LAVDAFGRPLPIAGMAYSGLGELARKRNDLEVAKRHVLSGIELSRQWGALGALDGYITLAHISQTMGDLKGAESALLSAQELAARFDASEIDDIFVSIHQVHLAITQGRIEAATEWLMRQGLDEEPRRKQPTWYLDELQRTTAARIYLAQGQPGKALALLKPIGEVAEAQGRNGSLIENLNLQALALQQLGDSSAAVETLSQALQLAEPEGYIRVFLDEGQPMIQLLRQAATYPSARHYAGKLLLAERLKQVEDSRLSAEPGTVGIEPHLPPAELLSERERQVLQLIAIGLSNREIATRLVIANSTVKTHINHIFRKLAVNNRTQAIVRARELDLL